MTVSPIPQFEPWFGNEEKEALADYMESGGWVTEFARTTEFEDSLAKYTNAKHCVVVNNGTISLTLAALVCDLGPGDEVIVPNYTMVATPNSVKLIGAKPVFVDVERDTLCLDIDLVTRAITNKTKAIILVSANGRYAKNEVAQFEDLCAKRNLFLIEDAAQALGSFYPDGRHIGTVGIAGTFSFSTPKIISTGQGGAIVTNDDLVAKKLRLLKDFGRAKGGIDIHETVGYNFKFTDIQAVIGLAQLKKLNYRIKRKKEIYKQYREKLKDIENVQLFYQDCEHTTPWFIDAVVDQRDELSQYLKANDIGTRLMYPPINTQPAYAVGGNYPVSEIIGSKGLWLPSSNQITKDQIDFVCSTIRNFYIG